MTTRSLPAEVEEDLAQTVSHLAKHGMLQSYNLREVLLTIACEVGLEPQLKAIISSPNWVHAFKERWAHKLSEKRKSCLSSSFANITREEYRSQRKHGILQTMTIRPLRESTVAIVKNTQAPDMKFVQESRGEESLRRNNQNSMSWNSAVFGQVPPSTHCLSATVTCKNNRALSFLTNSNRRGLHPDPIQCTALSFNEKNVNSDRSVTKYSTTDGFRIARPSIPRTPPLGAQCLEIDSSKTETMNRSSDMNLKNAEVKFLEELQRECKGLRGSVKPVEYFQYSDLISPRKKSRGKEVKRRPWVGSSEILISQTESHQLEVKKKPRRDSYLQVLSIDEEYTSPSDENTASSGSLRKSQLEGDLRERSNFSLVHTRVKDINDFCLACGTADKNEGKHPLFMGGLCRKHNLLLLERFFMYDSDGYHSCCSVCCMGSKVVLCDVQDCGRCYCKQCLDTLVSRGYFDKAVGMVHWVCNFCADMPGALLKKRPEWREEVQRLFKNTGKSQYPPFHVPAPIQVETRRPIRVLSLFDGIATGVVALKQLGLEVGKFVASEIDEDAIRLVQNKHPEVVHIGDVTKITDSEIYEMGPFDLLLGGSPCNDLSGANPKRRGLVDAEGTGCLFFDFYRILRTIEPPRNKDGRLQRPFFWLFENVVSMKSIEKERISRFLQCQPKMADARYVSAAARPRLFWGNLPGMKLRNITPGVKDRLTVQECLEAGRVAQVKKLNTITTKYTCLYQGQRKQAPVLHNGKEDVLWTTELERVFGVPEHYTDVNNLGPRERLALLGRSWSVPVARLLLSPLKEYFSGVQQQLAEQKLTSASWWN